MYNNSTSRESMTKISAGVKYTNSYVSGVSRSLKSFRESHPSPFRDGAIFTNFPVSGSVKVNHWH